jgi:hypothetical protein
VALLALAPTLPAATVTNCDEASLRAAMSGGGLVTFDCDGTITLTTPIMIVANVTIDAVGRRVIIAGGGTNSLFLVGATRQLTLRSLTLSNGTSAAGGAIRSEAGMVSATNCSFISNTAVGSSTAIGGAIFNNGGSLNVVRCTFSNNRAYITGTGTAGVGGENGPGGVGGSGWAASGGAIWNSGLAFIHETYFVGNTCTGGVGGTGGVGFGGFVGGSGGVGGDGAGGAVFHESSTMGVTGSTFASNSVAGGSGGTGGNGSGAFTGGNGGTGGVGGTGTGAGIHAHTGAVLATNNTWFRNRATGGTGGSGGQGIYSCSSGGQGGRGGDGFGGAIFASSAASIISHSTLALNAANAGSGGAGGLGTCITTRSPAAFGAIGTGQGGGVASLSNPMTLTATIFAFNLPGGNSLGSFIDTGFNISSDATPAFTNQGGWNNLDPKVLPLTNNGGPTPTIALQPDSPAIDHGAIGSGPPTDQRGVGRTNGLACDAGAYEFEQPPGLTACDADSLRASVAAGGVVSLGCDGTYSLTTPLVITKDTTIDASGRSVVLSGGSGSRVILVNPGVTLNLIHVTIKDGMSTNGAGIYNDGGIVTLIDCIMATNKAVGLAGVNGTNAPLNLTGIRGGDAGPGTDARGGGIFNAGVLRITNSAFLGNRAQGGDGGAGGRGGGTPGVYDQFGRCFSSRPGSGGIGASGASGLGGAIYNLGEVVMKDVSIAGNRAIGGAGGAGGLAGGAACLIVGFPFVPGGAGGSAGEGRGGAIFNQGQLDLSACALFRNSADGSNGGSGGAGVGCCSSPGALGISGNGNGGAIYNLGTNILVNVTMAYNTVKGGNCADAVGGAFDNAGQVRATNCTIWANTATGGSVSNGCPVLGGSIGSSLITRTNALTILVNSIVGNADSTTNCVGVISDGGHNICSDASAAFSAPGSLNSTAPKLGPLADNGGTTLTFALDLDSPAINAGDGDSCPPTDQRGIARPVGTECDIGAVEGSDGFHYPALRQSFSPGVIIGGATSTLRLTLMNFNSSVLSNISFTNPMPPQLFISSVPNLQSSCGGGIVVTGGTISVSGVNLGPNQVCSIAIDVTSTVTGLYTNLVGPVFSAETGPAPSGPATLAVNTPPTAATGVAVPEGTSALLSGEVNPGGLLTRVYFEFGTTTNYGMQTPTRLIGSARVSSLLTNLITGLATATEYHFRIVAVNGLAMTFGHDQYFVTLGTGPGASVRLDGVDDFVITPDLRGFFSNETVTIEVWFRADAAGVIVDERGQLPPQIGWGDTQVEMLTSGEVRGRVWPLPSLSLGTAGFGSWNHVALRYDKASTNLDGFVNGVEAASDVKGDRAAPWETGRGQYYGIGLGDTAHLGSGAFFRGDIGEVRIWNVARTSEEIRANMFRRLAGTEPGLVCCWRFDEGTGALAGDASGHGNAGTLVHGAAWVTWPDAPRVETIPASNVTAGTAVLLAEVNPNGTNTAVWFEWGLTTNYGQVTPRQDVGSFVEPIGVSSTISSLLLTEYHFRAVASNSISTAYGRDESFHVSGPDGTALCLDGVDDFVITPDLTRFFSNETVTIELWFRPLDPGVIIDELGQVPPSLGWHASHLEILQSAEVKARVLNLPALSLGLADLGVWHHAVLRYDRATTTLDGFLDGVESAAKVQGDRLAPWEEGYGMFYAFGLADISHMGSGRSLSGEIDEVRIWNTRRSNEEICAYRFRRLTGQEPGLVAYWRLDESSGPLALDASGHGNHGNLINSPQRVPYPAPVLDPLRIFLLTGGRVEIDAIVCPLSFNVLQASTNFVHWTSLATNQATTDGLLRISDPEPALHPWRFYRVRLE